jgi:hypothetical protein
LNGEIVQSLGQILQRMLGLSMVLLEGRSLEIGQVVEELFDQTPNDTGIGKKDRWLSTLRLV